MAKVYDNATDLITFARSSSGTALRRVGYGDEIFGDPSFDGTGDWSLPGTSVTVSGGKLTYDAVSNIRGAEQNVNIYAGRVYQASFEVLSGTARLSLSTGKASTSLISDLGAGNYGVGVHHINVVANGDHSTVGFTLSKFFGGTACELAYFSMKEVFFDRATDPLVLFNHPDDTPRIEYGSDGSLKGLLIEEQRTNLVTYSEDFSQLYESSLDFTYGVSSPTGGSNATIFSPTSNNANAINLTSLGLNTGSHTGSVWAKGVGSSVGKTFRMWFWHLSSTGDSGIQTFTLTDEWQRFDVLGTVTSTGDTRFRIDVGGAHAEDFHVFGLQLEAGSFATSYIPTSGSQQTRSADIASIPVSAFGYNQDAGTVVVEAVSNYLNSVGRTFTISDGTTANRIQSAAYFNSHFAVDAGGSSQASLDAGSFTQGQYSRLGGAYATDNVAVVIDGGTVASDTSATMPTGVTTMTIGCRENQSSNFLNGHIKSIQYYPRRLTNTQLQELTS